MHACNCTTFPTAPIHAARRGQILTAAVAIARSHGFRGFTRAEVARKAGVATGLVNRYFGTMDSLKDAVMHVAIEERHLAVVAQGIAILHPVALGAPAELRAAAVASVGGDL